MLSNCCLLVSVFAWFQLSNAIVSYTNVFIDPDFVLTQELPNYTSEARQTITEWAVKLAALGPWTVMNKSVTPPSGDKHDYMSWAPYAWPNCTSVKNTTDLAPEQIWVTCPYYDRDGEFNPDGRLIDDIGAFSDLADAVLYNSLAWAFAGRPTALFAVNVVNFIKTWFLDPDTKMNPNLNYAQMFRGPKGQFGRHTGVLDLKCFTKIVSGILILRQGNCVLWTQDLNGQLSTWIEAYINWLETAPAAIIESQAPNNHGSFYYAQLASLKLFLNDTAGALNATTTYFRNQYKDQIIASGEQPFESVRTRPYHYRAYNLCAMITNAHIQQYLNRTSNVWKWRTAGGATIHTALNYAMTISPNMTNEGTHVAELFPDVAAIAAVYGDNSGSYKDFLQLKAPEYNTQPYYFWYQPKSTSDVQSPTPSPIPVSSSSTNAYFTIMTGIFMSSLSLFRNFW